MPIVKAVPTRRVMRAGAVVLLAAVLVLAAAVVRPRAQDDAEGRYFQDFSDGQRTSRYHVLDGGVDRSRPVGVAFFFDGDSTGEDAEFWNPYGDQIRAMAAEANRRNLVLVPVLSPEAEQAESPDDQITWWLRQRDDGEWFRALARHLLQTEHLDSSRVWLTGYSGGADFITDEALAQDSGWIRGGGATIVGGGEGDGFPTAPSAALKGMALTWHEGTEDVPAQDDPQGWSGTTAGRAGWRRYRDAGFTRARFQTVPGVDHGGYDVAALFEEDLERADVGG